MSDSDEDELDKNAPLDAALGKALNRDGITMASIGRIDVMKIKWEGIETAVNKLTDSVYPLSTKSENLSRAAKIFIEIRKKVIQSEWEKIPDLLDSVSTTSNPLPDACRIEFQATRHELDNRLLVSSITDALENGKVSPGATVGDDGVVYNSKGNIHFEGLESTIGKLKSIVPRSEMAISLMYSADVLIPLRKGLRFPPINWSNIQTQTEKLLKANVVGKLNAVALPEIKQIYEIAVDAILITACYAALRAGKGPSGGHENLDISEMDLTDLNALCSKFPETFKPYSQKGSQLLSACRFVKSIREYLTKALCEESEAAAVADAWKEIKQVVALVFKTHKSNHADAAWEFCKDEVMVAIRASHVYEMHNRIKDNVTNSNSIYLAREKSETLGGKRNSNSSGNDTLSCSELDVLIDASYNMDMISNVLSNYIACAQVVRRIRNAVIDQEWSVVTKMESDSMIQADLKVVPEAILELNAALSECRNRAVYNAIDKVLSAAYLESEHSEHTELIDVIAHAESVGVTAVATMQLLGCARQVLQLRIGISKHDSDVVAKSLNWIQDVNNKCPALIVQEAVNATMIHHNNIISLKLRHALSCYRTDDGTADSVALGGLLEEANDVTDKSDELKELLDAAEMIYALRCARRVNDIEGLKHSLLLLSNHKQIHSLVLEEVALARAEIDNVSVINILSDAIQSFDEKSSTLGVSLKDTTTDISVSKSMRHQYQSKPVAPAKRRYSLLNMKKAEEIDPETIDIDVLNAALVKSEKYGLFTVDAKRLYRTLKVLVALRSAMKENDWSKVETVLMTENGSVGSSSTRQNIQFSNLDPLADREIQAIRNQLEMRNSVAEIITSLSSGHAVCINGVVDRSKLYVVDLMNSIDRACRCFAELSHTSDEADVLLAMENTEDNEKERKLQNHIELLLSSAKYMAELRSLLLDNSIEAAGVLAEKYLKDANQPLHSSVVAEMETYASEIGLVYKIQNQCSALNKYAWEANTDQLDIHIDAAVEYANNMLGNETEPDLGLVLVLEQSLSKRAVLCEAKKQLEHAASACTDRLTVQNAVKAARDLRIPETYVQPALDTLSKITFFENFVGIIRDKCGGVVVGKVNYENIARKAAELSLSPHVLALHSELMLKLNQDAKRIAVAAEAVKAKNAYIIATETIRIKGIFLSIPAVRKKFKYELFPGFRDVEDFAIRMTLESSELKVSMLSRCVDKSIPTSITKLPPALAALSVWIFSHCIRPIELQVYSYPDVVLRNMILLGRYNVAIRDEILALIVKQLRGNEDAGACDRLWRLLGACLYHFPPSQLFESYLELFLRLQVEVDPLKQYDSPVLSSGSRTVAPITVSNLINRTTLGNDQNQAVTTVNSPPAVFDSRPAARRCIRMMHESIVRFGYTARIVCAKQDLSVDYIGRWLSPTHVTSGLVNVIRHEHGAVADVAAESEEDVVLDPAFSSLADETDHSQTSCLNSVSSMNNCMRGGTANWISRFKLFSKGFSSVDSIDFLHNVLDSLAMDRKDAQMWLMLVCGVTPTFYYALVREMICDHEVFMYESDGEREKSIKRRRILKKLLPSQQNKIASNKFTDKHHAATDFWNSIIFPVMNYGNPMPANVPTTNAVGSAPTTAASKEKKKSNDKSSVSATSLREELNFTNTNESLFLKSAQSGQPDEPTVVDSMTWSVYRDILLAGMELLISSSAVPTTMYPSMQGDGLVNLCDIDDNDPTITLDDFDLSEYSMQHQ